MALKKKSIKKPAKQTNRKTTTSKRSKKTQAAVVIDERLLRIKAGKELPLELRILGIFDMPLVAKEKPETYYTKKSSRSGLLRTLTRVLSSSVSLWVMAGLLFTHLVVIPQTRAFFSHEFTVAGIELAVGSLKSNVSPDHISFSVLGPNITNTQTVDFQNTGTLPILYTIHIDSASSSENSLCDVLELTGSNGTSTTSGTLSSFVLAPTLLDSGTTQWIFTASLPTTTPDSLQGQTCNFTLTFNSTQENNNTPGFTDSKQVAVSASAGFWIFNISNDQEQSGSTSEQSIIMDISKDKASTTSDSAVMPTTEDNTSPLN